MKTILILLLSSCHLCMPLAHSTKANALSIPDIAVIDQDGNKRLFYSDLVQGQSVAINFIFTSCQTICPVSGASFGKLAQLIRENPQTPARLISISLDPVNDTPTKLRAWADKFGRTDRWSLVTGSKRNIDRLLKAIGAFDADKNAHMPLLLLGHEPSSVWNRVQAFTAPEIIWKTMTTMAANHSKGSGPSLETPSASPAPHPYFPNTLLVDHHGNQVRFFSDLIQGRVVVIQCFFSTCTTACPVMLANFKQLQNSLGEEVDLLSITVDPQQDTPERLRLFATSLGAGSRWKFLSGPPDNVELVLHKLGYATKDKEAHSNVFIIGNERSGLWKKARGSASAKEIAAIVDSVVSDKVP